MVALKPLDNGIFGENTLNVLKKPRPIYPFVLRAALRFNYCLVRISSKIKCYPPKENSMKVTSQVEKSVSQFCIVLVRQYIVLELLRNRPPISQSPIKRCPSEIYNS